MRAAHLRHRGVTYLVGGFAPQALFSQSQATIADSFRSFTPLTEAEAEAIQPNRIDMYVVRTGDTWTSIAERSGGLIEAPSLANHERRYSGLDAPGGAAHPDRGGGLSEGPTPVKQALRVVLALAAVAFAAIVYVWATLPDVRPLATENPTTTAFMALRAREAAAAGRESRHAHEWVAYDQIPPHLRRAVTIAEDDAFFQHEGVDFVQLRRALEASWETGAPLRGASTITQQLAKNLYLSPARSPIRKFRELIIARRLEAALSRAHSGDLSQRDRVGRGCLGRGGCRARALRRARPGADARAGGAAGRRHHQPRAR